MCSEIFHEMKWTRWLVIRRTCASNLRAIAATIREISLGIKNSNFGRGISFVHFVLFDGSDIRIYAALIRYSSVACQLRSFYIQISDKLVTRVSVYTHERIERILRFDLKLISVVQIFREWENITRGKYIATLSNVSCFETWFSDCELVNIFSLFAPYLHILFL